MICIRQIRLPSEFSMLLVFSPGNTAVIGKGMQILSFIIFHDYPTKMFDDYNKKNKHRVSNSIMSDLLKQLPTVLLKLKSVHFMLMREMKHIASRHF